MAKTRARKKTKRTRKKMAVVEAEEAETNLVKRYHSRWKCIRLFWKKKRSEKMEGRVCLSVLPNFYLFFWGKCWQQARQTDHILNLSVSLLSFDLIFIQK